MGHQAIGREFVVGVACAFLALAGAATAAEVPQNELTSTGDVLSTPPARAVADASPACAVAEKFTAYLSAHEYDKIGSLYARDAVLLAPTASGDLIRGADEIAKFVTHGQVLVNASGPAEEIPVQFLGSGNECFYVLAFKWAGATNFRVGDVHHVVLGADGKIIRDTIYVRPGVTLPAKAAEAAK